MSFPCDFSIAKETKVPLASRNAKTLGKIVTSEGVGLFTGEKVKLSLKPAQEGHGVVFQRMDLEGQPCLRAELRNVQSTPRCTILGQGSVNIQTVEHLMAAISAYEIDNILIQIWGNEIPIFDGSALAFVKMIEEAEIQIQQERKIIYSLEKPVFWSQQDIHLIAIPSDRYRISYTLHYPQSKLIGSQFYSTHITQDVFKKEIAPCRTFSIYEEVAPLIEKGFFKGGSLENAIIIKNNVVLNPEGLRFNDEMTRHKILDIVGDIALIGSPFVAHFIAIRSGHSSNHAFALELLNHFMREFRDDLTNY